MAYKGLFNTEKSDYTKNPLFLGEDLGLHDSVNIQYPELEALYRQAVAQNWSDKEFDFSRDAKQFAENSTEAQMMIDTIATQWEMDSVASRSMLSLLAPFITNTELYELVAFNSYIECLTPEHEVFKKGEGWVQIPNIKAGDTVLQFNPETEALEFVEVTNTIEKEYKDDIVVFGNKMGHYYQATTKGHRMLVKNNYGYKKDKFEFVEAKDVNYHGRNSTYVSGFKKGEKDTLTWKEKLWIAFQADGSYPSLGNGDGKYNGKRSGSIVIRFGFKRDDKKENLEYIVSQCGYKMTKTEDSREGYTHYYVYVPVEEYIYTGKTFGWIDLDNVSSSWCKDFIHELYKWDGCNRKKSEVNRCLVTYTTTQEECADIVTTIAHFAGYRAKHSIFPQTGKGTKEVHQVTISDRMILVGNSITKEYVHYDGKVHCITVPSGAFLVRHDNRISVTGNCVHSGTYSEIVRNAFPDPKAVIDDILSKEDAMTRATLIGQVMEELYVVGHKFALGQLTKEEVFPTLYKGIVALFLLERGQFVASFAITFALGEAGMFQECAAAIRKVCADEVQIHASADVVMLRELRKMGFWEDYKDNEEFQSSINAFVEEVYQGELLWTEQLFKDRGSLCGLSCQDIKDWVTFNFQIIRQELDLPVEITIKENPLPYMEKWMTLNALQQANQETTSLAYLLDATKDDSAEAELDF